MQTYRDEKGKIFTPRVTKHPVPAIIQTLTHRIRGQIYLRPGTRLLDEVNQSADFIAVTQAEVLDARGQVIHRSNFLSVNRQHIVWLLPVEEADTGG